MTGGDLMGLTVEALRAHRLRYGLSALAIAVGVAAVVLLSSIGEGTRRYIMAQMTQFGTTLVAVTAGKVQTGGIPGVGGSAKRLTLDDARALARIPGVDAVTAEVTGTAEVKYRGLGRRVYIYGCTADAARVWQWRVAQGDFLPPGDIDRASPVVVLGPTLKRELFGDQTPLGAVVRIGLSRFRVIGVMEPKGQFLGFDFDDGAFVPVATAIRLFNLAELQEVDLMAATTDDIDPVARRAKQLMLERHQGQEDVTIITQKDAQETVNRILGIIAAVVTCIAGISLLVGAIGILTIMWIVVQERVPEIGLVKALGARRAQLLAWYLFEAAATALVGGAAGLGVGMSGSWLLARVVPGLSTFTPPGVVALALAMALGVGLIAGVAPAMRAAALDPVEALRAE